MSNLVNKWQLNRAGFLNYWYYDEEEFQFTDGRLLLRGSNGSGKSVTMQSLITVLLDGVKNPDRLDSFGSRSRRMEDYLLGEKEIVNRDERTGYLYLEYKRQKTEQYITTGIGLQARRGGTLDFFGFVITDNRRIRFDIPLYKREVNPEDGKEQRVPLTRAELERAIGVGGHVVRSQKEYMELGNRYVFGFETTEQYQELMKLLIQLRSPKLSKDFKPSVIYEILNESLPSLSDEELRPLSDTIESMERTKLQIEQLERDRQALGRLCRQYDLYNAYILAEKADLAQKAERRLARLDREVRELADQIGADRRALALEQERRGGLERELAVLQREKQELEQHDVFRAEQQKLEREQQLAQALADRGDKERQLAAKQRKEYDELQLARNYEQQRNACRACTEQLLEELAQAADAAGFDGHSLLVRAFADNDPVFSFAAWRQNAKEHAQKLESVLALLRRQAEARKRREQREQELGEERRLLDNYRAEHRRLEQRFVEHRDQLLADIYQWHQEHSHAIPMDPPELRQVARALQGLYEGPVWSDVRAPVEAGYGRRIHTVNQELGFITAKMQQLETEEQLLTQELSAWKNKRDPEPERSPDVQATRAYLSERGIPFSPLYAAVEFKPHVAPELRERIEAAMTDMGLLDALIVPRGRLKDIPVSDTYGAVIHPNPQIMAVTLADYLYPTPAEGQGISAADIDEVLRSILVDDRDWRGEPVDELRSCPTLSPEDGVYRIGLLSGRAPRRQTAVYIGKQARQEYRQQRIALLEQQIAELAGEQDRLHASYNRVRQQLDQAREAFEKFPVDRKIREIHHSKQAVLASITHQEGRVALMDTRLRAIAAELQSLREQLQAASAGFRLSLGESEYMAAEQAMRDYQHNLHEQELCRRDYENSTANARQCRQRLEEIRLEVDHYKGELLWLDGQISKLKLEIEQINARLEEMGAEELRERIRKVAVRLEAIPKELEFSVETAANLQANVAANERRLREMRAKFRFLEQISQCWGQILKHELRLGLVYPMDQPLPGVN